MITTILNHQNLVKPDLKKIKKLISFVIENEFQILRSKGYVSGDFENFEFIIYLINEKEMIKLHENTFGKATPTDVVSFGYLDNNNFCSYDSAGLFPISSGKVSGKKNKIPSSKDSALHTPEDLQFIGGEIFVSVEQAKKVFRQFKSSVDYEILLYIIHGILHVFNYDDCAKEQKEIMRKREKFYMNIFSFALPISKK